MVKKKVTDPLPCDFDVMQPRITAKMASERLASWFKSQDLPSEVCTEEMVYCSWPEAFGSTAGPFGGVGGQAVTQFRLEAWEWEGYGVVFCGPKILRVGHFQIGARWKD